MKMKVRVIDSLWTFFVAVAIAGPFALPLLWRNPRFTWKTKAWGSFAVLAFTAGLVWISAEILQDVRRNLELIRELQQ